MPELLDAYSLEVDTDIARDRTPEGALAFQLLSLDGEPVVNVQLSETTRRCRIRRAERGGSRACGDQPPDLG